jgi:hypothetical protein
MTLNQVFSKQINDEFPPKFVVFLDQAGNHHSCPIEDIQQLNETHKLMGYNNEIPGLEHMSIDKFSDIPVLTERL